MKQSQVRIGVLAMLTLPRKGGSVRVEVRALHRKGIRVGTSASPDRWLVTDSNGAPHIVTARQLRPMPHVAAQTQLIADYTRHLDQLIASKRGEPGQTIDNGDTVITTTLHRLG